MSLELRLQLLEESGQIGPEVADLTRHVIRKVEERYGVALTEENGAMFVTHLAVALERLRTGQAIDVMLAEGLAEVKAYPREWAFVSEVVAGEAGRRLGVKMPEGEIGFLTAHLITLLHPEGL
ncbi:MAG: PRD domain-containing protein [Symbiobacterium sp.]|uniref:PRD domain-containing protein n=1 Tax=Symbiobacterium sp. TaxID=1971213 RepID=UPI003464190F